MPPISAFPRNLLLSAALFPVSYPPRLRGSPCRMHLISAFPRVVFLSIPLFSASYAYQFLCPQCLIPPISFVPHVIFLSFLWFTVKCPWPPVPYVAPRHRNLVAEGRIPPEFATYPILL